MILAVVLGVHFHVVILAAYRCFAEAVAELNSECLESQSPASFQQEWSFRSDLLESVATFQASQVELFAWSCRM